MKRSSQSLFLIELVFCLFLFVVCTVVCAGLLLHARSLSQQSEALVDAVYLAQSAAEAPQDASSLSTPDYLVSTEIWTDETGAQGLDITVQQEQKIIYTLHTGGPPQ